MGDIMEQLPGQIDILSQEDPGEYDDLFIMPVDEYKSFLSKFEAKKTTDDCYTPPAVYDAVAEWVSREYGVDRKNFVRPFFPGGDYQRETYRDEDIVVDNPPFSIVASIVRFYCAHNIRFFLFTPALTAFIAPECPVCYLTTGVAITYENGAVVNTSFCTNIDPSRIRTVPDLRAAVEKANALTLNALKPKQILPKYTYPDSVITAAAAQRLSQFGVDFTVQRGQAVYTKALDEQKSKGKEKGIFGGGFILAERAAAERAAAMSMTWSLSERETAIQKTLKEDNNA